MVARRGLLAALIGLSALAATTPASLAVEREVIDARVRAALVDLQALSPGAAQLLEQAAGVLVMPRITRGGFVVAGQYGEGALIVDDEIVAYYALAAGSVGFQAGVETFSQVLLFMTPEALAAFRAAEGWTAGVNAEVTLLQQGFDVGASTEVTNRPVIAFVFGRNGLLAGASVQGAKYVRLER